MITLEDLQDTLAQALHRVNSIPCDEATTIGFAKLVRDPNEYHQNREVAQRDGLEDIARMGVHFIGMTGTLAEEVEMLAVRKRSPVYLTHISSTFREPMYVNRNVRLALPKAPVIDREGVRISVAARDGNIDHATFEITLPWERIEAGEKRYSEEALHETRFEVSAREVKEYGRFTGLLPQDATPYTFVTAFGPSALMEGYRGARGTIARMDSLFYERLDKSSEDLGFNVDVLSAGRSRSVGNNMLHPFYINTDQDGRRLASTKLIVAVNKNAIR